MFQWSDFRETNTTQGGYYEAISPSGEEFASNDWLSWDERGDEYGIPFDSEWQQGGGPPAYSPDGRYLASGTLNGIVLLVHLDEVKRRIASLALIKLGL